MPVGPRPAPPVGSARVAMSGTFRAVQWVRVFYLELTGAGITVNDLQTLADEIKTLWAANTATELTTDVTLAQVDIRYIPSLGNELRFTGTYSQAATGAGVSIDDGAACFVVDYVISSFYRGGHPRSYMPGVDAGHVTDGKTIDAAKLTSLVTKENAFRNALNSFTTTNISAIVMGTVAFSRHNAWLTPPVFEAFTSVKAGKRNRLGSQRRRLLS